jgi:hypothetical protein
MFEPMNFRRTRWAPSPSPSRIYPTWAILECRTRAGPSSVGEGWGEGLVGKGFAVRTPHRPPSLRCAQLWRPTSPTRGEVDRLGQIASKDAKSGAIVRSRPIVGRISSFREQDDAAQKKCSDPNLIEIDPPTAQKANAYPLIDRYGYHSDCGKHGEGMNPCRGDGKRDCSA